MEKKTIEFDWTSSICNNVRVVGNKLFVTHEVEHSREVISEKKFPGDDRDWKINFRKETLIFLLPKNHDLSTDFVHDFSITYVEIEKKKYFLSIDVLYQDGPIHPLHGWPTELDHWKGNEEFDIKDY